jgi:hypothetical protein
LINSNARRPWDTHHRARSCNASFTLQGAPARALEWELPLEELRALVAGAALGGIEGGASPSTIMSHGLEWLLEVEAMPAASGPAPPQLPAAPTSAAPTRPVQVGLYLQNNVRYVPDLPTTCTLTGLSFRLEAVRDAGDAAAGAGGQRSRVGQKQELGCLPNSGRGWPDFFPILTSGSVDDPALAPFLHTGPGGAKGLRLRGEVLGLE